MRTKILWMSEHRFVDFFHTLSRNVARQTICLPMLNLPPGSTVHHTFFSPERGAIGLVIENPIFDDVHPSQIPPNFEPEEVVVIFANMKCNICGVLLEEDGPIHTCEETAKAKLMSAWRKAVDTVRNFSNALGHIPRGDWQHSLVITPNGIINYWGKESNALPRTKYPIGLREHIEASHQFAIKEGLAVITQEVCKDCGHRFSFKGDPRTCIICPKCSTIIERPPLYGPVKIDQKSEVLFPEQIKEIKALSKKDFVQVQTDKNASPIFQHDSIIITNCPSCLNSIDVEVKDEEYILECHNCYETLKYLPNTKKVIKSL